MTNWDLTLSRELAMLKADHEMKIAEYLQYKSPEEWEIYFQGGKDVLESQVAELNLTYHILGQQLKVSLEVSDS